jgi:hypothetical protein
MARSLRFLGSRPLKAVGVLVALALVVIAAIGLVDRESSERVAGEQTPTATPTPRPVLGTAIAVATAGDPSFLDLLAAPVGAVARLATPPDGRPSTADPSRGTVVLYRSGAKETAQMAGYVAKIDRVEPLTADDEGLIDSDLRDADVVVVFGTDDQERLLRDRNICAPAGSVADESLTLCVARSDESRFSRFAVNSRALPIDAMSENGWWSWAAAAPDGGTILAKWTSYVSYIQATSGCSVPQSALIPADGGRPQPVTTGPAMPLGWTTHGQAIVFRPAESGCRGSDPGVYLVTPDGKATLLGPTDRDRPPPGLQPSIEPRTVEEVTRAAAP